MLVNVAISSSVGALASPAALPAISLTHSPIASLAALAPVVLTGGGGGGITGGARLFEGLRGVKPSPPILPANTLLKVARWILACLEISLI